jgi:hypothetical protein
MKSYQSANEPGELLLDHVIITVKDLDRSIAFYETTLKPLGSVHALAWRRFLSVDNTRSDRRRSCPFKSSLAKAASLL